MALALVGVILGGCGGGSDDPAQPRAAELDPLDLVRLLPQDAQSYSTVDLSALKRGLGLPSSAQPYEDRKLIGLTATSLGGVYATRHPKAVVDAPALPSATALASSFWGRGRTGHSSGDVDRFD